MNNRCAIINGFCIVSDDTIRNCSCIKYRAIKHCAKSLRRTRSNTTAMMGATEAASYNTLQWLQLRFVYQRASSQGLAHSRAAYTVALMLSAERPLRAAGAAGADTGLCSHGKMSSSPGGGRIADCDCSSKFSSSSVSE